MRKDKQATMDKQYLDPRSYLAPDGREVLYGDDWKARIEDLRLRSGGRCEYRGNCLANTLGLAARRCEAHADDPHHVIRRSVKRDDRLPNLLALCRFHHDLLDKRKVRSDRKEFRAGLTSGHASTTPHEVGPAQGEK